MCNRTRINRARYNIRPWGGVVTDRSFLKDLAWRIGSSRADRHATHFGCTFNHRKEIQMKTIQRPEPINPDRRRFLGTAAMTLAAAQLALTGSADAQSSTAKPATLPAVKPGDHN